MQQTDRNSRQGSRYQRVALVALVAVALAPRAVAQAIGLPEISAISKECIDCHKKTDIVIYQQWGESKHFRGNVACYECHAADRTDVDARTHYGRTIATLVTPRDCGRCHSAETAEFMGSHHSKAGRILGSLDNRLAEVVEGNNLFVTPGFANGNSAAAVNGCWQCHGSQIRVLAGGLLDPATWPNSGIGRINPDGSEGACNACHTRHTFSVAQARHPDTCGKCHLGPDHPQKEIYEESKHGILFFANEDRMNLHSNKWIVGEDYWAAPTCATCHMSATRDQAVTHDVGMRISWNNRPVTSIRPESADEKMGLPGADVPWQVRRANMQNVCINCHEQQWIENFYVQYDGLVSLYNTKFAVPGAELYELALPLRRSPETFANEIDYVWFELWHHEGRRARHAAAMMAPDYTHWHGTYELARNWYAKYLPMLEDMVSRGRASGEPSRVTAADALDAKLQEVLHSESHRWSIGEMDPAERERRAREAAEFRARYGK
ncbi:MAG: hydroxylamine oxidoreductase [Planctomycetes bacterium]|nr:hydroxylamine oxidoreductase [Planctomycetota bacterium]